MTLYFAAVAALTAASWAFVAWLIKDEFGGDDDEQ